MVVAVVYEEEEDEGVEKFPFPKPKGVVLASENKFVPLSREQ